MKTGTKLCSALLLLMTVTAALGQSPAPKTPAAPAVPDPTVTTYNTAVKDFNSATAESNAAKKSGDPAALATAQADTAKNIAEIQALLLKPQYQGKNGAGLHNLLGYLYLLQDDPTSAIPELQATVQDDPNNFDARNNLGNSLRETQPPRYDEAATQYQYILAHPQPAGSRLDPGSVKFNLATVLGQAGRTDESLALFQELVTAGPSAPVLKNYGFFLQKAGRSADAAQALRQAAELNPKDAQSWLNAGELYAQVGSRDEAISALTKAVGPDVDPKLDVKGEYDAYFALGEAYAAQSDPNQAIKEFTTAAQLQPDNAIPLYNKGVLEEQAGLKSDAETSYRSALKLDPNSVQVQTALGLLLADRGSAAEAASFLSEAAPKLTQDAKAAPVYARLGDAYAKQGDAADANQARLQALALNPADADTRLALADSYLAQKQYVSALVQYDQAAQARPSDAAIQNQRGVAYENLRQYPKALAAFRRALALSPRNAQVQNNIGVAYEQLHQPAQAMVAYKKALAMNPSLAEARRNLNRFARP